MADTRTDEQRRYHSTVKERLDEDAKNEAKAAKVETKVETSTETKKTEEK